MTNIKNKPKISLSVIMVIVIAVTVSSSSGFMAFLGYSAYRDAMIKAYTDQTLSLAMALETAINPEKFETTAQNGEKDEYWYEVKDFLDHMKVKTGLTYLYVLFPEPASEGLMFFADAAVSGGSSGETSADFQEYLPLDFFPDETLGCVRERAPLMTDIYSSEDEGFNKGIGAFVPIFDRQGSKIIGIACVETSIDSVLADIGSFGFFTVAVLAGFLLVVMILTVFISRKVIHAPIAYLCLASERLAAGEMGHEINTAYKTELGGLARDFQQVAYAVNQLIESVSVMTARHNAGETDALIDTSQFSGAYKTVAEGINGMVQSYVLHLREAIDVLHGFSGGDFTKRLSKLPGRKARLNEAIDALGANLKAVDTEILALTDAALGGNLSKQIDTGDFEGDWAQMTAQINRFVRHVSFPIREFTKSLEQMSEGDFDIRIGTDYRGDFLTIKTALLKSANEISSYINEINDVLARVAAGDLRLAITREYIGQFASIKVSINMIIKELNETISEIASASGEVLNGAEQIARSAAEITQGAQEQASSTEELTTVTNEINSRSKDNAVNSRQAAKLVETSKSNAEAGNNEMKRLLTAMGDITDSSKKISNIIKTIEDIAFQTNLLALNAAVESARAGVHGKGFSVVADEVRSLASKSGAAAKETGELIQESIGRVNEGMVRADETAGSLAKIVANITDVSGVINKIYESSTLQTEAIGHISIGLEQINHVVMTNSSTSEESSAASQELNSQADTLKQMIAFFKTE